MKYAAGLATGEACACIPLVGAPSDRSGGATITLALDELRAKVTAEPALGVEFVAADAEPLLQAAARQLLAGRDDLASTGFRLELVHSDIPVGVGLGASSAVVVAALEALSGLFGLGLAREQLPPHALACLNDQLDRQATLRDPVAQVAGGLTFMDFDADGGGGGRYEPLDLSLLPPLFVAWPAPGERTDDPVPSDEAMAEIGKLAQRALSPLLVRDTAGFAVVLERNRELLGAGRPVNPLAEAIAGCGLAVTAAGSHGAVAGLFREESQLDAVRPALAERDAELLIVRPG